MGKVTLRQHEPLYAPSGWNSDEQSFVNKLERLFDTVFAKVGDVPTISNDFTDEDKAKLDSIEYGATATVTIESITEDEIGALFS